MRMHMPKHSELNGLFCCFPRTVDISHLSDDFSSDQHVEFCPHLLVPNKRPNRLFQHFEEVLPGGLLYAPIAVGAHSQPSAAKADCWQRPASACYLEATWA